MTDIVSAFLSQSSQNASGIAVDYSGNAMTYAELATLSARMADRLMKTFGPQPKVLLHLDSSPYAYAGMIGTLMVGGTFCAVATDAPTKRIGEIAVSFKPDVILSDRPIPSDSPYDNERTRIINVSSVPDDLVDVPTLEMEHNETAYVVFTSGSTGRPKGVRIARQAFSYFVDVSQKYFSVQPGERWAQYSNLGYDLAIMDVFMALCHGATLVPLGSPMDRLLPARAIRDHRIQIWQSVPSVLDLMLASDDLNENLLSLRVMSFCGEPLLPIHLQRLFQAHPNIVVFNTYGTTETTGFNTINILTVTNYMDSCRAATVALGDDVPGWQIILGDGSIDSGQISVCSARLSLGYWEDEERTKASFTTITIGGKPVRAYFTGDWGERIGHKLYFRGRIDRQVKIKGERIELDEIDFRLRELGCRASGSILIDEAIYSFVEADEFVDEETVRKRLAQFLAFHALPKKIIQLEKLPRNQNGKIAFTELRQATANYR